MDQRTSDWSAYWDGVDEGRDALPDGSKDQALSAYWTQFWRDALENRSAPTIVDLACGAGAASRWANDFAQPGARFVFVDAAVSALAVARGGCAHGGSAVAADVRAVPLADGSADIVVSQFGVEYGGYAAFLEAARLVTSGGCLAMVCHRAGGPIERECTVNRNTMDEIIGSGVFSKARCVFEAGFALRDNGGSEEAFLSADKAFAPAIQSLRALLNQKVADVESRRFLRRFYTDLGTMYQRMAAYQATDVMSWLAHMEHEAEAYRGRMQAMLSSALQQTDVNSITSAWVEKGFTATEPGELCMGSDGLPVAWLLCSSKV